MNSVYYNVFALLTAGYLFLKYWNYSHYRLIKFNGQELFLASGTAGTIIFTVGYLAHQICSTCSPLLRIHSELHNLAVNQYFLHELVLGVIITFVFVIIFNSIQTRKKSINKLIKEGNDGLELMLLDSAKNSKLLMFTLNNRKVYIGKVNGDPFSPRENKSFQILPFTSGYRNFKLNFVPETDYSKIYIKFLNNDQAHKLNEFSTTLMRKNIINCNYFDHDEYEKYNL